MIYNKDMNKTIQIRLSEKNHKKFDDLTYMLFNLGEIESLRKSEVIKEVLLGSFFINVKSKYDEKQMVERSEEEKISWGKDK